VGDPRQRLLGDRYELGELLATGGMGQVWRARDTVLHRTVAVKVLRPEFSGDPTFLARFRAEAQHTAVLAHRNIATLHDYGEAPAGVAGPEPLAYLVMELVEGDALSDLLVCAPRLDVERTLDLLRQTADALATAHRAGVVHRDVKPGNVLVGDDGVVKITDFGIAWSASSVPLTQDGQVVGTAHYLSPEQAAGGKATPASDVYALGLIGYECLAGRRAFDGDNAVGIAMRHLRDVPDPLPDDVPPNVRTLIERALVKDPAQRYPDGAAFRDAVDDVLAGRRLRPAPRDGGTQPFALPGALPMRRRRVVAPLVALLAGVGIAIAAVQLIGLPPTVPVASGGGAPTSSSVILAAADYVGRPVDDVESALGALGLAVERVAVETGEHAPGTVTAISPAGAVSPGALIAVSYAVAPPSAPAPAAPVVVSPPPAQPVADQPPPAAGSPDQASNGGGDAGDGGKADGKAKGKAKEKASGKAKGRGR
jgi:serine/threonine-protein kinase